MIVPADPGLRGVGKTGTKVIGCLELAWLPASWAIQGRYAGAVRDCH